MAAKLSGGGGGRYAIEQNSEINVTPFVDIMLVLLIIFMVAAPMATPAVELKLPTAIANPAPSPPKPFYISIQGDGDVFLGDSKMDSAAATGEALSSQIGSRNPANERIYIRADQGTRYGDFMQVMNSLQDYGFYSVALVGEDNAPL
jgi:biopolymer transport protein ExbD